MKISLLWLASFGSTALAAKLNIPSVCYLHPGICVIAPGADPSWKNPPVAIAYPRLMPEVGTDFGEVTEIKTSPCVRVGQSCPQGIFKRELSAIRDSLDKQEGMGDLPVVERKWAENLKSLPCQRPGSTCPLYRRAISAALDVAASTLISDEQQWCHKTGAPCAEAQREAMTLAGEIVDNHMDSVSNIATNFKRDLVAVLDHLDEQEKLSDESDGECSPSKMLLGRLTINVDNLKPKSKRSMRNFCSRPGQSCRKVRNIVQFVASVELEDMIG